VKRPEPWPGRLSSSVHAPIVRRLAPLEALDRQEDEILLRLAAAPISGTRARVACETRFRVDQG